jgi:hypothetical protein
MIPPARDLQGLPTVRGSGHCEPAKQSRSPSTEEIASVAPLLRNDSFLVQEERWRRGVTRNDHRKFLRLQESRDVR